MKVVKMDYITREFVRANPDKIFLFGDNVEQRGFGGQAASMRGEPNALGIPTKHSPSSLTEAYFDDKQYVYNTWQIWRAFKKLYELNRNGDKTIVIPYAGLGTGLAELDKRAPKTFKYLQDLLNNI